MYRTTLFAALLLLLASLAQAAQPLQSQFHGSGNTVDVLRAQVKDGVLTVVLRANAETGKYALKMQMDGVYYIDPKSQRKYLVLRDEKGDWIANPSKNRPGWNHAELAVKAPGRVFWFKFPAPESDTTTINLVVPDVTPFDDLPIQR